MIFLPRFIYLAINQNISIDTHSIKNVDGKCRNDDVKMAWTNSNKIITREFFIFIIDFSNFMWLLSTWYVHGFLESIVNQLCNEFHPQTSRSRIGHSVGCFLDPNSKRIG